MTNWDSYYARPAPTAALTRRYTERWLTRTMQAYASSRPAEIIEFGGGNSFCCEAIARALPVARYDVADYNEAGLALFRQKATAAGIAGGTQRADLLHQTPAFAPADIVFSVGLVEHFSPQGSRIVAARHFDLVKPGGIVIITAPTPTLPYRATRKAAELLGIWAFPDERPMAYAEVEGLAGDRGRKLAAATLWPLVLTQRAVVWRAPG